MKILVYGAGNIGSLYAVLLKESGQDVSILARGSRLADIRDRGIQLDHAVTGQRTDARVNAVEGLDADDTYDLVLVVLPKNHVSEVLPILAANHGTPTVMFFGNNAAGPGEMIDALGRNRVLLGFPGAAASRSVTRPVHEMRCRPSPMSFGRSPLPHQSRLRPSIASIPTSRRPPRPSPMGPPNSRSAGVVSGLWASGSPL